MKPRQLYIKRYRNQTKKFGNKNLTLFRHEGNRRDVGTQKINVGRKRKTTGYLFIPDS